MPPIILSTAVRSYGLYLPIMSILHFSFEQFELVQCFSSFFQQSSVKVMNKSKLSTDLTLKGPQMSVWIISKTPWLLLAPFLIFLGYFPLMQSMHFSSSKTKDGSIFSLMRRSIPPSKYGINDSAIISKKSHYRLFYAYYQEWIQHY